MKRNYNPLGGFERLEKTQKGRTTYHTYDKYDKKDYVCIDHTESKTVNWQNK